MVLSLTAMTTKWELSVYQVTILSSWQEVLSCCCYSISNRNGFKARFLVTRMVTGSNTGLSTSVTLPMPEIGRGFSAVQSLPLSYAQDCSCVGGAIPPTTVEIEVSTDTFVR